MIVLMQEADKTRHLPQPRRQSVSHTPIASNHEYVHYSNDWINELKGDVLLNEPGFENKRSGLPVSHHSQRRRSMGDSPLFFLPDQQISSHGLLGQFMKDNNIDQQISSQGLLGQFMKDNSNSSEPIICKSMPNSPDLNKGNEKKIQPKKKKGASQKKVRSDYSDLWNLNFQKLLLFRQKHNHCVVPCDYTTDPSLARWVKRQRHLYHLLSKGKKSSLKQDRILMLNNIGFSWDAKDALWQERLKDLNEFKLKHGHCVVPTIFPSNQRLATWVKFQRRQYKLYQESSPSYMTRERIENLNALGFEWTLRSSKHTEVDSKVDTKKSYNIDSKDHKCWIEIMSDLTSDCEDDGDYSDEPVQSLVENLFQEEEYEQGDSQDDDISLSDKNLQSLLDEFSSGIEEDKIAC